MDSDTTPSHLGRLPAVRLAQELRTLEDVQAVCLYGSAARGMPDDVSDLDLLVVTRGETDSPDTRARIRRLRAKGSTDIRLITEKRLRDQFSKRTVFAAHLAREAKVLLDQGGAITDLLDHHPKEAAVEEDGSALLARLKAYENLEWCGGRYLLCLADLYAWGRSGAMLVLARGGEFEFDHDGVFAALATSHPHLASAAAVVQRLRPFWLAVRRRREVRFPFPPDGAHDEARAARDACAEILTSA